MCKRHGHSVRVQATKSDFAKEFMSEAFKEVAAELGMARVTATAPHHKNSLARLDNAMRSVQSMASAMLHHGQAPPNEWGRATKCSCCLHRRLPNSGLGGLTPVEKTRGSFCRPDISKFRVFCSPVFIVKTSREKHRSAKFGPTHHRPWEGATSFLGCFLGCRENQVGSLVRVPNHKDPVFRHDVCFVEDITRGAHLLPKRAPHVAQITEAPPPARHLSSVLPQPSSGLQFSSSFSGGAEPGVPADPLDQKHSCDDDSGGDYLASPRPVEDVHGDKNVDDSPGDHGDDELLQSSGGDVNAEPFENDSASEEEVYVRPKREDRKSTRLNSSH